MKARLLQWVCLAYATLALLWIGLDSLLLSLPEDNERLWPLLLLKDTGFIVLTTLLLYLLGRRRLAEQNASYTSLRQAAAVFDSAQEGVLMTDAKQRILYINPAFTRITGYSENEVLGKTPVMFKSGRHDARFYQSLYQTLQKHGEWSGEIWNRRKTGEVYPQWQSIRAIRDREGELSHYVAVFSDLSMLRRSQAELDHLAHYDPLTGLPNRLLFNERIQQGLERARAEKDQGAILLLDLDHFKHINESLGHRLGDQLLKAISQRLIYNVVRQGMTLARLGGDEFGLVSESCLPQQAATLAVQIIEALNQPFQLGKHDLMIGVSIGVSLFPNDAQSVEQLLRNADSALNKAKHSGRATYAFYTQELTLYAQQRVELAISLRQALLKEELRAHYQPIHDLDSGRLIGFESLVRWQHPERGLVPPGEFIPIAEENGLISDIDLWMLEQACLQMRAWLESGCRLKFVAVNISSRLFNRGILDLRVAEILARTGLPAQYLELEITESTVMRDPEVALEQLQRLRELGIRLAIDDFGTGHSSLLRLKRMPVHKLKIDQGFVAGLPADSEDAAITRSVIMLAHSLGLTVLAEGIERPEQMDFLKRNRCDLGQGYLFGKPLPVEQLAQALEEIRETDTCSR